MDFQKVNRIFIGLLFLLSGLWKIFFTGASSVEGMVGGLMLFSWAPGFWAWVLILSEIIFGFAVIFSIKLRYTVLPLVVVMLISGLFMAARFSSEAPYVSWSGLFFHMIVLLNLLIIGGYGRSQMEQSTSSLLSAINKMTASPETASSSTVTSVTVSSQVQTSSEAATKDSGESAANNKDSALDKSNDSNEDSTEKEESASEAGTQPAADVSVSKPKSVSKKSATKTRSTKAKKKVSPKKKTKAKRR